MICTLAVASVIIAMTQALNMLESNWINIPPGKSRRLGIWQSGVRS
jgi:hypothetical protein